MAIRCALIVDGVPVMARMLVEVLGEAGWDAAVSARLGDALAAIESGRFSVVVSDVEIADGDGFELLRRVRSRQGPGLPVILTSSFDSPAVSRRAEEDGAFGFLLKPYELSALLLLLESAHIESTQG